MSRLLTLAVVAACGSPAAKPATNTYTPEAPSSIVIAAVYAEPDYLAGVELAVQRENAARAENELPFDVETIAGTGPIRDDLDRLFTEQDPAVLLLEPDPRFIEYVIMRVGVDGPPIVSMGVGDGVAVRAMAEVAIERGWTTAAAIVPMPDEPQVDWRPVESRLQDVGGSLLLLGDYWLPGQGLRNPLEAAAAAGVQVVLVPMDPAATCLAKSFFGKNVSLEYIGMASAENRRRMERGKCDGTYFVTRFAIDDPNAAEFVAGFRDRFGREPTEAAALGHDAVLTAFDAFERASTLSHSDVREALSQPTTKKLAAGANNTLAVVRIAGGEARFVTRVSVE